MLRPRDGIGIQTHSFEVTASPNASVSWAQDVFGNTVGTAVFQDFANTLEVIAVSEVVIDKPTWPVFDIIADAILYPFAYSRDDLTDLGELSTPQYPTDKQQVLDWALVFYTDTRRMRRCRFSKIFAGLLAMSSSTNTG